MAASAVQTERIKNGSQIAQFPQAAICCLAVELLAAIFELTMADTTHVTDAHRISQVCAHWRHIAHGTSRLWTRPLRINLSSPNAKGETAAECLRAWLARSTPLCVSVCFKQALPGAIHCKMLDAAFGVAAPRLRALQLQTMPITPMWLVKMLAQCALDNLEELDLGLVAEDPSADADAEPRPFAVPALRTLQMTNFGELQISVPWAQLTELTFECDSLDVTFKILRQCAPLLVTASIAVLGPSELSPEHHVPVHLSHLRTLSLRLRADLIPLLDHLTAPLLTTLRLTLQLARWDDAPLTGFVRRAPGLTRLECARSDVLTPDAMCAVLGAAPALTHLALTECGSALVDEVLRALTASDDGVPPLAPRLHDWVVHDRRAVVDQDILAHMLVSRWWPTSDGLELAPRTVARWTRVVLHFGQNLKRYYMGSRFTQMVKDIPPDVLEYPKAGM
ncbi:hypothetical protein C8R45DRAFT_1153768 [Mycena sanguinolenta]|nr:hypothetical protein C8R45DRAFT_1153768 [Mycena sanguinolenta]